MELVKKKRQNLHKEVNVKMTKINRPKSSVSSPASSISEVALTLPACLVSLVGQSDSKGVKYNIMLWIIFLLILIMFNIQITFLKLGALQKIYADNNSSLQWPCKCALNMCAHLQACMSAGMRLCYGRGPGSK